MPTSSILRLRRPSEDDLQALVDRIGEGELSYDEVGATVAAASVTATATADAVIDDPLPDGYHHHRSQIELGTGDEIFQRARTALSQFAAHRGSGIVVSSKARVEEDAVVAVAAPLPIGHALAVCRIVRVIDEAGRFGFAYGTIAGHHPESGEELFLIETAADDRVDFRLVAFSRPGHPLTKLAGPIAPILQERASKRYLQAMRAATNVS